jgi:hypothetical protein
MFVETYFSDSCIDEDLIYAMMAQESRFDASAKSYK